MKITRFFLSLAGISFVLGFCMVLINPNFAVSGSSPEPQCACTWPPGPWYECHEQMHCGDWYDVNRCCYTSGGKKCCEWTGECVQTCENPSIP